MRWIGRCFFGAAMLGVTSIAHAADDGARCLTPEGGRAAMFLPDGRHLIYLRDMPDGQTRMRLLDVTDGATRVLPTAQNVSGVAVSPDGQHVAYAGGVVYARRIYVLNVIQPAEPWTVTPQAGFYSAPSWIDRTRVAFAESQGDQQRVLSVSALPRMPHTTQVMPQLGTGSPVFAPDGKRVAMVRHDERGVRFIVVLDVTTGEQLAELRWSGEDHGIKPRGCYDPAFSPDGQWLAYANGGIQPMSNVHLFNMATSRNIPLTTDGADNHGPDIAPDGRSLVYCAARHGGEYKVYLMSLKELRPDR